MRRQTERERRDTYEDQRQTNGHTVWTDRRQVYLIFFLFLLHLKLFTGVASKQYKNSFRNKCFPLGEWIFSELVNMGEAKVVMIRKIVFYYFKSLKGKKVFLSFYVALKVQKNTLWLDILQYQRGLRVPGVSTGKKNQRVALKCGRVFKFF